MASASAQTAPLTISKMPIEPFPKIAKGPKSQARKYSKAAHNYSIVDDLAQSTAPMSTLEVFQSCQKQQKTLLSALVTIDPTDMRLMAFDLDKATPRLASIVTIQVPVLVHNISIH